MRGHVARPLSARLWERVVAEGECLVWTGTLSHQGYGQIGVGGRRHGGVDYTHRVSYELAYGPIPEGLDVCHKCDNRRCVRREHLFAGTRADNMRDAQAKGRTRGTFQPVITTEQVVAARRLLSEGLSLSEVARRVGVSPGTVRNIRERMARFAEPQPEPDDPTHATGSSGAWPLDCLGRYRDISLNDWAW